MSKLISVVILSWNRKQDIVQTLDDLLTQDFSDYEVIIVDQGSTDGTIEMLEQRFVPKGVKLICLHKNLGVPGGRNVGAVNARGRLLVFLDNDASFGKDALRKIVDKFQANPTVGIIGFKILNAYTKELDMGSWVYQKNFLAKKDEEFLTYTFCGCGHAIRKEVFEKAGFYWDDLFFSWEEPEFSLKALNCGFGILFCPEIQVFHRISPEKRVVNSEHECRRLRNSLWVSWRYFPFWGALQETFMRAGAYLVKGMRHRCFFQMLFVLITSFRRFGLIFNKQTKIRKSVFAQYRKLSSKGNLRSQIETLFK